MSWRRLTDTTGVRIDVNLDTVCTMQSGNNFTILIFNVHDGKELHRIDVRETIDQIHLTGQLRGKAA